MGRKFENTLEIVEVGACNGRYSMVE
jgi:hypothetical protein